MFWNYFSSSRFCVAQRSLTVLFRSGSCGLEFAQVDRQATSSCMFRPRADSCTGHVVQMPLRNCQQTHGSIAPRHVCQCHIYYQLGHKVALESMSIDAGTLISRV